ncbi:hypothetical protein COCNU_07G008550 [Cocos nucifera]|uniref:Steroid 5-alpha reductase C-terminal domain-containing protein n=1 Tax=Cocos nucifera TaxID=13894 RepID=A0A8K0IF75_COCNU|nr:hypothetical protein COCNU_07G008550 [Cocos nucifera]
MENLKNATIALLAPLPSLLFFLSFLRHHHHLPYPSSSLPPVTTTSNLWNWCYHHPFLLANLLFFFNVDILFWLIGLLQSNNWVIDLYWTVIPVLLVHYYASHPLAVADAVRSAVAVALTWVWSARLTHNYFRRERWRWGAREDWRFNEMRREYGRHWWWVSFFTVYLSQQVIDLYWTVIPVLLVHYYASHPLAVADAVRSAVAVALTWVWSARLTHNYFRRERWRWGAREDWRFNEMRREYGRHWWWVSFFTVYLSQQVFLIGICLPMYAIHSSDATWNSWDSIATIACITGIVVAYFADTQLYDFVSRNETLKELGAPLVPNLDKGLWWYSRHPNYFGEQLWWWGLFLFAWNIGQGWMFIGPLVNSLCLAYVTVLVEQRMLKKEYRAEAYWQYQKTTSVWIPWFKTSTKEPKEKDF